MENEFLDKAENNAVVQTWSEKMQLEKGDSVTEGYTSKLWDFTRINVTQNNLQELKEIWAQWDDEVKQLFYCNYGDLPYLLDINVDEHLFRALAQFWNSAYSCFTFGEVDMVPTVEEYTALLRCPRIQVDKVYARTANVLPFTKKLAKITGMSEQWVTARIKQKGENKCIPWRSLRDQISVHPDTKKKVDVLALSIYGLGDYTRPSNSGRNVQIFKCVPESGRMKIHRLCTALVSLVPQSLLEKLAATPRRDDISGERWMAILQNLRDEDVEWKAPWMVPDEILYRCGDFDWVPLLGIWGAVGYTPLLVLRQYRSRQFIPATQTGRM
ncbi:uncharacterized protein LOC128040398 [Gossypium raimondii]|uniref:uncharacterized protein LOC128040398 n=1 Tax=Gossypium raimondii TaxID=29730 RepID=UPI00227CE908|nr:uncharacterized protein LOC128040398 [Gossypium raimondii]